MTDEKKALDDGELETFFAAGRSSGPDVPQSLLARIEADAIAALRPEPRQAPPKHRKSGFLVALGGWPAMAGLAAATVAGVWIGYAAPDLAPITTDMSSDGYDLGSLLPGYVIRDDWSM